MRKSAKNGLKCGLRICARNGLKCEYVRETAESAIQHPPHLIVASGNCYLETSFTNKSG